MTGALAGIAAAPSSRAAARKGGPSPAAARPSGDLGHVAYVDPALNIVTAYQIIGKIATPIDGEVVARIGKTTGYSSARSPRPAPTSTSS